jgi:coenzyme F420-dependent glucose-6-phosphate dehydrogenase
MTEIGYQISLEQFQPEIALKQTILAEEAGFKSIWASDHFMPWFHTNASSGFAWVWLGHVSGLIKKAKIGTGATCPIFRYHPALVAQAFATLDRLHSGGVFLSLGTGEPLNEVPLGIKWPSFNERLRRLEEAINIIKKLWSGEFIDFKGEFWRLKGAKLYTPPLHKIPIYVAASGPTVAQLAGKVADGLLTIPNSEDFYKEVLFPALQKGIKLAGRSESDFEKHVEVWISYDEDYEKALDSVRPWAGSLLPVFYKCAIADPREIEKHGGYVGKEQLEKSWVIATSSEAIIKTLEKYKALGFDGIHFTSSSPDQEKFITLFKKEILPYFG